MKPNRPDVLDMVTALNALLEGTRRARKQGAAAVLSLLQEIARVGPALPSTLASDLNVHQSTITRQARTLHGKGYIAIKGNPEDGRSCLFSLSAAGRKEIDRLTEFGLSRYELFVADWSAEDVRTLGRLLNKLTQSMAAVGKPPRAEPARSWRKKT